MSFIRPDIQYTLRRWRELSIGAGSIALGAYCALGVGGLLDWVGVAGIVAGAALGAIGIRRARFRATGHGPGAVAIDEGEVTYMYEPDRRWIGGHGRTRPSKFWTLILDRPGIRPIGCRNATGRHRYIFQ